MTFEIIVEGICLIKSNLFNQIKCSFLVLKLTTLRKLFPNLAVIRGRQLFHNYALVIYSNDELVEIALENLTDILNGGVRIEKNPLLCYTNTIAWNRIIHNGDLTLKVSC